MLLNLISALLGLVIGGLLVLAMDSQNIDPIFKEKK